ncbi:hypothetical protein ACLMJK_003380 [Lecanora helva]
MSNRNSTNKHSAYRSSNGNRDSMGHEMASVLFAIGNMGRDTNERGPMPNFRPTSFTPMVRPMSMASSNKERPTSIVSSKKERPLSFAPSGAEECGYIEQALSQIPPRAIVHDRQENNDQNFYPQENEPIAKETEKEAAVVPFNPGYRFYMAFSSLAVLAMMVSLDGTSVSVALPKLAESLHGSAIEAFWTGTSFLLSSSIFQPPLAALSHIFGRMPTLTFCTICFMVGIIISSVAQDFTAMLIGRTIQGVGGGGIILLNDVVITDLVPMRLRGAYFGMIGAVWGFGSVSGPVVGGVLSVKTTWRWIFWINLPFAAIGLVMVPLFLKLKLVPGSIIEKSKRVDWIGNFIFIASATSFLIPLTWGGVQYPWDSWHTLVPLLVGVAGMAGFCVYERRWAVEPTIRLELLVSYNLSYSLYAALINALVVYGALYFLPLYFEAVQGYTPIVSGVALFPATLTVAPVSIISGIIITKTGDFHAVTWFGWFATTLGCGIMCLLDVDTTIVQWIFLTLVAGVGLGLLYTSLAFVNQSDSKDEDMAFAISLFVFARAIGQCLGVAICGVIFQNEMKKKLLDIPALAPRAVEYSRDASSLVQTIKFMPAGQEKNDLLQAYADSLQIVWAVLCALSGSAFIGSFFMRRKSLDRAHNTAQGLKDGKSISDDTSSSQS